jgi:transcription elongation GreA/GreB family factor
MSRAFVKETDEVVDGLPDRPVSPYPNLVTRRGLGLIEAELARLSAAFAKARGAGDRAAMATMSRDLRYWAARRASADVQERPRDAEVVRFGATVTIERDDGRRQTFRIVGEDEADPAAGLLSHTSPLARALMGKRVGEVAPAGQGEAEVVDIGAV